MVKPARTLIFFPHSVPEKMLEKKNPREEWYFSATDLIWT